MKEHSYQEIHAVWEKLSRLTDEAESSRREYLNFCYMFNKEPAEDALKPLLRPNLAYKDGKWFIVFKD